MRYKVQTAQKKKNKNSSHQSYRLSLSEHAQNAENGNEEERKLHLVFAVEMNEKQRRQSRYQALTSSRDVSKY